MGAYSYSNDLLDKLNTVVKKPATTIASHYSGHGQSIPKIRKQISKILLFVENSFDEVGAVNYVLRVELNSNKRTKAKLSPAFILAERRSNNSIYHIDSNLEVISSGHFPDFSLTALTEYSFKKNCILIFILNGLDTQIFSKGLVIAEINAQTPQASPRINKKTARSAKDYRHSIVDFYKERVRTNVTTHWLDKKKRILQKGKTEEIFQLALSNWLYENVNVSKIVPKAKKISGDETDIEIFDISGDTYLIEIKWLGVNGSKTIYSESKIRDAIVQVTNYLKGDLEVLDTTLVVYDGRNEADFNSLKAIDEVPGNWKVISECMSKKLPIKGLGYVFFLISDSASSRQF